MADPGNFAVSGTVWLFLQRLWVRFRTEVSMCASYDFCSHVEVSTKGRSLVQRSPTDCVCVCVLGYEGMKDVQ